MFLERFSKVLHRIHTLGFLNMASKMLLHLLWRSESNPGKFRFLMFLLGNAKTSRSGDRWHRSFLCYVVIAGQKNGRVYCEMNRIFRIFSLAILLLLIA
jgi:hypothetical protein